MFLWVDGNAVLRSARRAALRAPSALGLVDDWSGIANEFNRCEQRAFVLFGPHDFCQPRLRLKAVAQQPEFEISLDCAIAGCRFRHAADQGDCRMLREILQMSPHRVVSDIAGWQGLQPAGRLGRIATEPVLAYDSDCFPGPRFTRQLLGPFGSIFRVQFSEESCDERRDNPPPSGSVEFVEEATRCCG